ncbi:aminoglycoside phosphotransferase family protein [Humibacter antri]
MTYASPTLASMTDAAHGAAGSTRMHRGQLDIEVSTVAALVADQFPQWATLAVRRAAGSGTMNALFRIGDALAARLPLVIDDPDAALATLHKEADAAHDFALATHFPAPTVAAIGGPGPGYPGPWCITTWIEGEPATPDALAHSTGFARDVAALIRDLRAAPVNGRSFHGSGRGGDLRTHDGWMATCFDNSEALLDVPSLRRAWAVLRDLPRRSPAVMSHTDLIPANLLVRGGRLTGVLDVGGFQAADPALDLVVAWHLLEEPARSELRAALQADIRDDASDETDDDETDNEALEWARGAAWSFEQAMGLVWYYCESNPVMSELGASTLRRIMASGVLSDVLEGRDRWT